MERVYRKQHPAAAYRVFAERGFDEGIAGHISVRDPVWEGRFWLISPLSTHMSQMRVCDLILVLVHSAGAVVQGDHPIIAAAFAIHSAIHKRRPDAALRAPTPPFPTSWNAWSVFGKELDMLTQDSIRFYKSRGVYRHVLVWFLSLDKTCQKPLLVDAAAAAGGGGLVKRLIPEREAEVTYKTVGTPEKGWVAVQGCYDEILAKTGGGGLR
ncbi:arad-like aldolase/epimerase [Karstenula rhodostoma CBS 690.94]|uniref:Arad-like aldolase/epimerase n=1 Tax=Karstenula rhodostoma CBS 690.94 TaxID=1392251 RepID=A0A9P4PV09_9PLEO|nr:arad-like aldolase/epimerase [Karstenula rhodostoma CBS 690.94]